MSVATHTSFYDMSFLKVENLSTDLVCAPVSSRYCRHIRYHIRDYMQCLTNNNILIHRTGSMNSNIAEEHSH